MSTICQMCRQITAAFFKPRESLGEFNPGLLSSYGPRHWPVDLLQESAARGCPLCVILAGTIDADFLPPDVRRGVPTTLGRSLLPTKFRRHEQLQSAEMGTMCGFALYVGIDDISHGNFFQIPAPWCDRYLPPLLASPSDDIYLGKTWLSDCRNGHPRCADFASSYVPTRLLRLSAFHDSLDFQLVETKDMADHGTLTYATLSHRWGNIPNDAQWRTTLANLQQQYQRIKHESLTQTFQDAVRISGALGINFLWIDSLCIIQDSLEDWEQEASLMSKVYTSSTINLAACSSLDGHGGCRREFHNSGITNASRFYDLDLHEMKIRMFEREPMDWSEIYDTTPIQQRGWVLQERELAPRTLHFCKDVVLWECKTSGASSELPWFETNSNDQQPDLLFNSAADAEAAVEPFNGPFYRSLDISPTSKALGMRHYWFNIVEKYSRKQLSKESDRLPALDGLAQASSHDLKGQYLAGIWRSEMPSALLWQIDFESQKPHASACDLHSNKIPSWSWASAGFGVTYASQRSWMAHEVQDIEERLQRDCDFRKFSIREARVYQEKSRSTSAVLGGSLHCSGLVHHLPLGEIKKQSRGDDQFISVCANDGRVIGILYPDTAADRFEDRFVYFTPVRNEIGGLDEVEIPSNIRSFLRKTNFVDGPMCMGIGMALAPGSPGRYRRIGLLRYVSEDALEAKEVEDFEIF